MNNFYKYFIVVAFVFFGLNAKGQDIHFSQFYNTPTLVNPALTGLFRYDYRGTVVYRNQWRQANAPFTTIAVSGDMNIPINPLTGDKLGVGVFFFNDQMGDGVIRNNTIIGSLAYHKILDKQKRNRLSFGLQAGYVQKGIDYSTLVFGNQIVNYQADPSVLSGEEGRNTISYFNLNAGVAWLYKANSKTDIHTGVSLFNVVSPRETIEKKGVTVGNVNDLELRPLWYGGLEYLWTEKISLHPEVMFVYQSMAQELNIGSAVGYSLKNVGNQRMLLMLGAWWRTRDAAIFMAGYRFKNYNICFTYDYTTSNLKQVRYSPQAKGGIVGAYEITITYMGLFKRALPNNHTIPCGIF